MSSLNGRLRACDTSGHRLAVTGHYGVTFRFLFGDVRVRHRLVCVCQRHARETKCVVLLDVDVDGIASELANGTTQYVAVTSLCKAADSLSELLTISEALHASMVRNSTLPVGLEVVQARTA